ncbi:MAG: helix-turn-helix transcriptional regulator [Chloroflexi bacterium]|nr:MAG: helix-turn-helix transcriptional regulator [Chloroflexota bacterium]
MDDAAAALAERHRDIAAIAALDDPVRRALYGLAGQPAGLGRDEAARAIEISRSLAAYHLDRMAELGLLDVDQRRPASDHRRAGRPANVYRWAERPISVSLPPAIRTQGQS